MKRFKQSIYETLFDFFGLMFVAAATCLLWGLAISLIVSAYKECFPHG